MKYLSSLAPLKRSDSKTGWLCRGSRLRPNIPNTDPKAEKRIVSSKQTGTIDGNVPGAPGIGIKTAAQLIVEYGDLETLLSRAAEIKQPKRREALLENAEKARISRQLVLLDDHVALDVPLDEVDDVLKSLVVFDSEGGVGGLELPGRDGSRAAFGTWR